MTTMRALSIRQPWAWAILHAGKDVENRTWRTSVRGPVLIHAGMKPSVQDDMEVVCDLATNMGNEGDMPRAHFEELRRVHPMRFGGIVGVAEIVGCVSDHPSRWFFGPHAFALRNARAVPFHPCRGRLGFFDVDYPFGIDAEAQR